MGGATLGRWVKFSDLKTAQFAISIVTKIKMYKKKNLQTILVSQTALENGCAQCLWYPYSCHGAEAWNVEKAL